MLGIPPAQVQNSALCCVEPHEVHLGPPFQPVKVPLNGIPSFYCVNRTTQLGVLSKLAEGALNSVIDVTDKDSLFFLLPFPKYSNTFRKL